MNELVERLKRAVAAIDLLESSARTVEDRVRLRGKRQGLEIALRWAEEALVWETVRG